ncbi:MAG: DUF4229 domain-containing protein [Lachnospiraceae bacterium]|nr:DUF4229 domain-containing protein [Lachnospiraceae bacterium]
MRNVFVYTFSILYALVVIVCLAVYWVFKSQISADFGVVFVIIMVVALPITYLLLRGSLLRERNRPESKMHEEFRTEILTNGYTEKSLGLADQVISEVKSGKKVNYVYLKDFVMYSADYQNQLKNYDKALELLNLPDAKDVRDRSIRFIDRGISLLLYLNIRMDAVCGLRDAAEAQSIKNEAHEQFGNETADPYITMLEMIDFEYQLLQEQYDAAKETVGRMLANTSPFAKEYCGKYYAAAQLCMRLNKPEEAEEYMQKAWEQVKDKSAALQQTYHMARTRFGMDEQAV